jgi:hypothetical protein
VFGILSLAGVYNVSKKSHPGDGVQNCGVKGGGLYLRHHDDKAGLLRRLIDGLVGRIARP